MKLDYKDFYKFLCKNGYIKETKITDFYADIAISKFLDGTPKFELRSDKLVCPACGGNNLYEYINSDNFGCECGHVFKKSERFIKP